MKILRNTVFDSEIGDCQIVNLLLKFRTADGHEGIEHRGIALESVYFVSIYTCLKLLILFLIYIVNTAFLCN